MQGGDFAAAADRDAIAVELVHEIVRHRLAQVGAAMEQRHERAAAGEPDSGLAGRVASADHANPRGAAELRLRRAGRVEHAQPLVVGESLDGESPVPRAGREQHRARRDLVTFLQVHQVTAVARLQRDGAVRRRGARVELAGLSDCAAGQLRTGDPGRESEVVLDPP